MSSGFTVQLKGLDEALKKLDVKKFREDIQLELNAFGEDVARDAKILAPVDEGHLKGSINSLPGNLQVSVTVGVFYAAYLEFGTRKFAAEHVATLPPDWQTFAAQFRGPAGGSFEEFVMNLVRWCKVKGIEEKAAYPIALSIIKNGIHAHPYLYPAYEKNRLLLIENLKKLL